jgi:hypothetical protein
MDEAAAHLLQDALALTWCGRFCGNGGQRHRHGDHRQISQRVGGKRGARAKRRDQHAGDQGAGEERRVAAQ